MKKLFVCYYNEDRAEVDILIEELRMRGIHPWIDHDGGFAIGDSTPSEARRVLQEECFGLLFYATPEAFDSDFIKKIEIPAAIQLNDEHKDFILFAVPRHIQFGELSLLSKQNFGIDLSIFHTYQIQDLGTGNVDPSLLRPQFVELSNMVLARVLRQTVKVAQANGHISINFNSKVYRPFVSEDILDIDWTPFLSNGAKPNHEAWERLFGALQDIRRHMSREIGGTKLCIRGKLHLSVATAIGRVFPAASGIELEITQGPSRWSTSCFCSDNGPFDVKIIDGSVDSDVLFVEVTATEKSVGNAVKQYIRSSGLSPFLRLCFTSRSGPQMGAVRSNSMCCAMARQIRKDIAAAIANHEIGEVHIFGSMPQALAMMIGHHLNASLPVQLYEYDGIGYQPSFRLDTKKI